MQKLDIQRTISILAAKLIARTIRLLKMGAASTLPGRIALRLYPRLLQSLRTDHLTIIAIAGTNGKTTTTMMVSSIMERVHPGRVISNAAGANLLSGITTTLLLHARLDGTIDADTAILEVDENALPLLLAELSVTAIVMLNLFRDQLDRYGEIHNIAELWRTALAKQHAVLVANADDPLIAMIGTGYAGRVAYFGIAAAGDAVISESVEAADSLYCPVCSTKLVYHSITFSHLGDYRCPSCGFARPSIDARGTAIASPLPGTYNMYNTAAAAVLSYALEVPESAIRDGLAAVTSAFGRQEILSYHNKQAQLFLAKNPTSFNQSLQTALELGARVALFILNDRIPDGKDVSWIWDINLEDYIGRFDRVVVAGDRVYDMALRAYYALPDGVTALETAETLPAAIDQAFAAVSEHDTVAIFPTYSAMLEVRQLLVGRKIL